MSGAGARPAAIHLVTILYSSADWMPGFLDCLLAQDMAEWRLVAIDNASTDGAAAIVEARADPRITVIRNAANQGFSKAANQGIVRAAEEGGAFFVLINNDTQFAPGFLRDLVAKRERLGADVIAPRIMYLEDEAKTWFAGGRLDRGWLVNAVHDPHDPDDLTESRPIEFASGCCLGLTRAAVERVGLLDESFFVYWEDVDLCMRLNAAGIPITYVRDPWLQHAGAGSTGGEGNPAHTRIWYRAYMVFLRKHFGLRFAARTMARIMILELRRHDWSRRRKQATLAAMLRGLAARLSPPPRLPPAGRSG